MRIREYFTMDWQALVTSEEQVSFQEATAMEEVDVAWIKDGD